MLYAILDIVSQCVFGIVLLRKAPPVLSDWGEENVQQVRVSDGSVSFHRMVLMRACGELQHLLVARAENCADTTFSGVS